MSQGDDVAETSTDYGKVAYLGPDGTYGQQVRYTTSTESDNRQLEHSSTST
jgi:hypothetical protein